MSARAFASDAARSRVEQAVKEVEAVTSAEVVVAVVPSSGHYRHTDYLVGFIFAFASLLVFLFHPHPFDLRWYPAELLAAFVLGTVASLGPAGAGRERQQVTAGDFDWVLSRVEQDDSY